ncbi:hypothetical protein ACH4TV_47195 [Streptomyces sp. NPDC020898]|uniref:hypothetical protein n=1 Tax=Streptomyces sp. NPDC020898 TaxID=3365101 RepID=UPI003792314B
MSEQTTSADTVRAEEDSAPSACCAAIADLRLRAAQAAALREQQASPSPEGITSSSAPADGA